MFFIALNELMCIIMSKLFFDLSVEQQAALIRQAEQRLKLADSVIEKDLWVCWLLEQLFALPVPMSFKGGTSLSKAYGLIKRFSEDVDITIDYRHFNPEVDFKNITRSQLKKLSDLFKQQLQEYIQGTLLPYLKEQVLQSFSEKSIEILLSDDGEQLRFYYPTVLGNSGGYLRDHVLLEFGIRNSVEPSEQRIIFSYLADAAGSLIVLPHPKINTLSPVRTFWEKATLIHVECHRERFTQSPERLSRHWYDLHLLTLDWVGHAALEQRCILHSVLDYKRAFFNASYAHYDECLTGGFKLVPHEEGQKSLAKDYEKMISAGMFQDDPPKFSSVLKTLSDLEVSINAQG